MEHICPTHKLILNYDMQRLLHFCAWPDCNFQITQAAEAIQESGTPTLSETWGKITFDTEERGGTVTITAHLPTEFIMGDFRKVYFLKDAQEYGMTKERYIEIMKQRMFEDLIRRVKENK